MTVLVVLALIGMQPPPPRWPQVPQFVPAWVEDVRTGKRVMFGPRWPWPERPVPEVVEVSNGL
jgi:hypothetical protein